MFRLDGRAAAVTGGSRGIGRAIALALAQAGADVAVMSRGAPALEGVAAEIRGLGRAAVALPVDVGDTSATAQAIDAVAAELGRLDILVNAAGVQRRLALSDVTPEDYDFVHRVNLRGAYFATQAALVHMRAGGYGRIINIASLTTQMGLHRATVYGATKGGIASLTYGAAVETAAEGITVNAIAPGYIRTQLTAPVFEQPERRAWIESRIPMGRSGEPEDMAGTAVFLASRAAAYVTGQVIYVDGGWTAA